MMEMSSSDALWMNTTRIVILIQPLIVLIRTVIKVVNDSFDL